MPSGTESDDSKRQRRAAARFFIGVGAAACAMKRYDTESLPLFPLTMIMEAEGVLARDMATRLTQEDGA